ncbi:unnamed protein product [Rotaria sp. Silwood2]|nr:unnamed protein product [Rotaria sp. Silwood2]
MERILLATPYPNLTELKLFNFQRDSSLHYFTDNSSLEHILKEQITKLDLIHKDDGYEIMLSKVYTKTVYAHILTYCEKLEHLNVTASSNFVYPSLSIRYLPSNTFSSSTLTYLCINVQTFTDFVCLLDGRLKQLCTLIVQFYQMDTDSSVVHNLVTSIAVQNLSADTYLQLDDIAFTQTTLADTSFTYLKPNTSNWLPKPPDSVVFYSNEGSSLAALVVERVTKMPYDQYVKRNILKPLNIDIRKTGYRLSDFENREELVKHYTYAFNESFLPAWNQIMPQMNITPVSVIYQYSYCVARGENLPTWLHIPFFSFNTYPSDLLCMSARSLSVFLRMFINNGSSLLTSRSVAEMQTIVGGDLLPYYIDDFNSNSTGIRQSLKFGLGWHWQILNNGHRYVGHGGGLPGMTHLMLVDKTKSIGVILLSNGDTFLSIDLSKKLCQTILDIHIRLFQCFENTIINE